RASFHRLGGPVQPIATRVRVPWRELDLSGMDSDSVDRQVAVERARFDLTAPPLLRLLLIRLGDDRHRLVVTMHHLVLDGWSLPILFDELARIHAAAGAATALPPALSYGDYLAWLARQDRDAALRAWREALAGVEEPTLVAPGHDGREPVRQLVARTGNQLVGRLGELAAARGLT